MSVRAPILLCLCLSLSVCLSVYFCPSVCLSVSQHQSMSVSKHLSFSMCMAVSLSPHVLSLCVSISACLCPCLSGCVFGRTPVSPALEKCKETDIYWAVRRSSSHPVLCEQYSTRPTPLSGRPILTCERCMQREAWCSATVPLPQLRLHTEGRRAWLSKNCRPWKAPKTPLCLRKGHQNPATGTKVYTITDTPQWGRVEGHEGYKQKERQRFQGGQLLSIQSDRHQFYMGSSMDRGLIDAPSGSLFWMNVSSFITCQSCRLLVGAYLYLIKWLLQ